MRPADEIKMLSLIAAAPPIASEKLTPPAQQRSWQAFERIFGVIQAQGIAERYFDRPIPCMDLRVIRRRQPLYARFMEFLVAQKEYAALNS